jgi:hypothetical protein
MTVRLFWDGPAITTLNLTPVKTWIIVDSSENCRFFVSDCRKLSLTLTHELLTYLVTKPALRSQGKGRSMLICSKPKVFRSGLSAILAVTGLLAVYSTSANAQFTYSGVTTGTGLTVGTFLNGTQYNGNTVTTGTATDGSCLNRRWCSSALRIVR